MDIQAHTGHVMPVLVDENIYYRFLKWMYSASYSHLAIREHFGPKVLIYGVWHAYKNLCLHPHKVFYLI